MRDTALLVREEWGLYRLSDVPREVAKDKASKTRSKKRTGQGRRNRSPLARRSVQTAIRAIRTKGGLVRTRDALKLGIAPHTLYWMRDNGVLEAVSRGLYRLADQPPLSNQDLATVAARIPNGVVCLISALAYHDMTTEIPWNVDVALRRGSEKPRLQHPPVRFIWRSGPAFDMGVEKHVVDGVIVRVYSPAKTVADCFQYRRRVGMDVAVGALKTYWRTSGADLTTLIRFARACRVEKLIRPYLEALA
ncbi:MAG: type IV toxin-antitoxin system AbiEi family antitoxin domain-containing protein [Candidatus Eisenbacteria sp.]|nr:type IV toxin-antitoxin system AbiEi family antitoxin domain-containing protein [Candidatus Eisenbacteria bacterium]